MFSIHSAMHIFARTKEARKISISKKTTKMKTQNFKKSSDDFKRRIPFGRRRVVFVAFQCVVGLIMSTVRGEERLFPNGSFEESEAVSIGEPGSFGIDLGSVPGWRIFAVDGALGKFTVSSMVPTSGGKNVLIVERSGGDSGDTGADTSVPVDIESDRVYKVLADVKSVPTSSGGGSSWALVGARIFAMQPSLYHASPFVFQPTPAYETTGAAIYAEEGFNHLTTRLDTAGKSGQAVFDNIRYEDVTTDGNRLINGGFENSTTRLIGWAHGNADGGEGSASLVKRAGVGGTSACLFVRDNAAGDVVFGLSDPSQRVPVRPGESLALDFDAKRAGENDACKLRISVIEYGGTGEQLHDTSFLFDAERDGFSNFHAEYTPAAGATSLDLAFRIVTPDAMRQSIGGFYIDNVSVKGMTK
jgi:hypothetical protein